MRAVARPVFVLGPLRCGASLLGWSLSQHPRLVAIPDGTSIGRIAEGLVAAIGNPSARSWPMVLPDSDAVCAAIGDVLDEVVRGGSAQADSTSRVAVSRRRPARWCDGTPGHAFHVLPLLRLFPHAKFIHVARDVQATVRAMVDNQIGRIDAQTLPPLLAEQRWLETTRACLLAERALGPDVVLRVQRTDLIASPEPTIRRCLQFVGEPFDASCLWPLKEYPPDERELERPRRLVGKWTAGEESRDLSRRLLKGLPWPRGSPRLAREALEKLGLQSSTPAAPEPWIAAEAASPAGPLRRLVVSATPTGATVLVISRGDPALVTIPDRVGWHFPQTTGGVYAGHHPATSAEAVTHLEDLRARGASHLAIPWHESWWLDHYADLAHHLHDRYPVVAFQEEAGLVVALQAEAGRRARWHVAVHRGLTAEAG